MNSGWYSQGTHILRGTRDRVARIPRAHYWIVIKHLIVACVFFPVALVLVFRWIPPPMTAFMAQRTVERFFDKQTDGVLVAYQWVDLEHISPHLAKAVIAAEDQKFPDHAGFDIESIMDAIEDKRKGGRLRGASTISQQTAKNLFLWPRRSFGRTGLEACFTVLLEVSWSKRRILEVYLNIAEFGDGVFGAYAASTRLLGKKPASLTRRDAARLAAALPNPRRFSVNGSSGSVHGRRQWILRQMRQIGPLPDGLY